MGGQWKVHSASAVGRGETEVSFVRDKSNQRTIDWLDGFTGMEAKSEGRGEGQTCNDTLIWITLWWKVIKRRLKMRYHIETVFNDPTWACNKMRDCKSKFDFFTLLPRFVSCTRHRRPRLYLMSQMVFGMVACFCVRPPARVYATLPNPFWGLR